MALRIGSGTPAPTQDPAVAQLLQAANGGASLADPNTQGDDGSSDSDTVPDDDSGDESGQDQQQVDQTAAGYQGPELGPFMCANCVFFEANGPGTCAIVAGKIDHMGCCNNFTSSHSKAALAQSPDSGTDEGDSDNMQQTGTSSPTTEPDEPEGT